MFCHACPAAKILSTPHGETFIARGGPGHPEVQRIERLMIYETYPEPKPNQGIYSCGAPIGIPDSSLPAHGQPLAGGTFVGRYEAGGLLRALVLMPVAIEGAWGPEIDVQGASSIFDGEANTLAMAAAGSEIALEALAMGAYIPSAHEFQVLLAAKAMGWADLDDSCGYWLSTQRSAESALLMSWADGQLVVAKHQTRPMRAVRNLLIL